MSVDKAGRFISIIKERKNSQEAVKHRTYSMDGSTHAIVDIFGTIASLYLANQLRLVEWLPFEQLMDHSIPEWLYPLVCLIWISVFSYHGVYERHTPFVINTRSLAIVRSVFVSTLLLAGALYFSYRDLSRGYLLIFLCLNVSVLLGWRFIIGVAESLPSLFWLNQFRSNASTRRVLIVGANDTGRKVQTQLSDRYDGISIVGFADDNDGPGVLGTLDQVRRLVQAQGVQDVIITLNMDEHERTSEIVLSLEDLPVTVRVVPDYFSLAIYKTQAEEIGGVALMNLRAPAINSLQRLYKRLFDIFVSLILIVLFLPVYLLVAVFIKLGSDGPVLFLQDRIGENGTTFKMYKFRSMVKNAESLQSSVNEMNPLGEILHKKQNDPRVTKIGRLLRSTSIDELPQLFNVLIGDMSLVGPRPELPWLVDQYDRFQRRRFAVPQGITGWWQINGRSDKPMHLNTDDDLFYIKNYSFWLDLQILFKTPFVVLKGRGAF